MYKNKAVVYKNATALFLSPLIQKNITTFHVRRLLSQNFCIKKTDLIPA
jgi:hypothetical protein